MNFVWKELRERDKRVWTARTQSKIEDYRFARALDMKDPTLKETNEYLLVILGKKK
jgi:hypothetical protein